MKQDSNNRKSWLVRVHQKINAGMADGSPRLAWLRSKFGMLITSAMFLTLTCNWVVIYGVPVESMPAWFNWLAQWVLKTIPGAKANVQHSWYLRDVFPYIYTVNLILAVGTFVITVTTMSYKSDHSLLNISGIRDILKFHCTYLVLGMMSIFFVLIFYGGLWLEPVFFPKPLPANSSASGGIIEYRMFETRFGALVYYGVLFGWGIPLFLGVCMQLVGRWYLSLFNIFYISLFKKEL